MTTAIDERPAALDPQPERRSVSFEYEIRSDTSAGLAFEGYAAVFGVPAEVRDYRGVYSETVERGAFTKTLQERKPLMLFEHGLHPLIGTMPVANLHRAAEDTHGVHIRGIVFQNWLTSPIVDGMRAKEITGLSYNFDAINETWSPTGDKRSIHELRLLMLGDDRASEISFTAAPVQRESSFSLRSILALREVADDEVRSALAAAHLSTAAATPEPHPEHSVPESTWQAYERLLARAPAG